MALAAQPDERGPVPGVVVLELERAVELGPQLLARHVLRHVLVELELVARVRVDEGGDELEEAVYDPGDCGLCGKVSIELCVWKEKGVERERGGVVYR